MAVLKVKDGSSSWHNIDSIKGDKGDTGTSIVSVTKTGSQGLVDTYTILFSDNTTTTFQVKNGENGQGSGSVTSVDTGVGLTGGAITSSGTIKADLVSDTYSTEASEAITQTSGRQYAVNPDANGKLSVNVPWTDEGKTYTAGTNVQISSSNVISATDTTYESKTAASGGTAVSLVTTGEKYTWNQAEPNVQSDWNATSGDAKILNKPTNVSAFTNDAGYLTSFTETDPTVPSWAKQSSKPTYTASEVGAVPTSRKVNGKALSADITLSASDVSALPSSTVIPANTSDLTNDSDFVSDASYVHTDNNYTSTEKSKLSGIAAGAEVNVQADWNQTTTTADDYIKNKPTVTPVAELTQAQYDALTPAEKSNGTIYCVTDSTGTYLTASEVSYGAGSVQGALDDVKLIGGSGSAVLLDANNPNGFLGAANGWDSSTTNYPTYFSGRFGAILTFPYWSGIGAFADTFQLFVDEKGNVDCRKRSGTTWKAWQPVGGVIVLTTTVSSLPKTITDSRITSDMVCTNAELSTASVQLHEWTVTTSDGSLTLSGAVNGYTGVTLYLTRKEN